MPGALAKYVSAFVDGVGAELSDLSGGDHRDDCMVETADLVSAVIASDGRLTAAEALGHREFVLTKLYQSA